MNTSASFHISTLYGDRSPCTTPSCVITWSWSTADSHRAASRGRGRASGQARRHLILVADVLEHHLGAGALHRIRHRHADRPQPAERLELGPCPQVRTELDAAQRSLRDREVDATVAGLPPRAVSGVVTERSLRRLAVPLRREQLTAFAQLALHEEHLGLLARLEQPELVLACRVLGDHPCRNRIRAVLGVEVGVGEGIVGSVVPVRAFAPHVARGRGLAVFVDPSTSARSPRGR